MINDDNDDNDDNTDNNDINTNNDNDTNTKAMTIECLCLRGTTRAGGRCRRSRDNNNYIDN